MAKAESYDVLDHPSHFWAWAHDPGTESMVLLADEATGPLARGQGIEPDLWLHLKEITVERIPVFSDFDFRPSFGLRISSFGLFPHDPV